LQVLAVVDMVVEEVDMAVVVSMFFSIEITSKA
jgi:hypothetical protein